jgi:hypothetical protein
MRQQHGFSSRCSSSWPAPGSVDSILS